MQKLKLWGTYIVCLQNISFLVLINNKNRVSEVFSQSKQDMFIYTNIQDHTL